MNRPLTLSLYGTACTRHATLRQLRTDLAVTLLARAENSGSEGCYLEVAAWCDTRGKWFRYAYEKFFGGELWRDHDAFQTCDRLARLINERHRSRDISFIHSLPCYETTIQS